MQLSPDSLARHLETFTASCGKPRRLLAALSGGRDSSVLLAALAGAAGNPPLKALHINHGLHGDADRWEAACADLAADLGVAFASERVTVAVQGGDGLEANARAARYAALAAFVEPGDWLLTAHHQDDQAETLLLNLMRGSGADGLRGMTACRRFGSGWLIRPLLAYSADELLDYARQHALSYIDDPSNRDTRHDRNFLRADIVPCLRQRWPAVTRQLAKSAALAGETSTMLDDLAAIDLAACGEPARLSIAAFGALPVARQKNLLRFAVRQLQLPVPPSRALKTLLEELLPARVDAAPCVRWPGAEARRYRDALYLMPPLSDPPQPPPGKLQPDRPLPLAADLGSLALSPGAGLAAETVAAGLELRYRQGGETLRIAGSAQHRPLKKLLQDAAVLPWMRDRLPLLYAGGELVAVADLWVADGHYDAAGTAVVWADKPQLF